jgi:general secretion pathway protein C
LTGLVESFRSSRWFALRTGSPWRWLHLGLAFVLIVQLARLFYAAVTPATPLGDWQARTAMPLPAAEQAALFGRFDPFYRQQAASDASATAVTALPLQLFGVRSNAATGGGSAIIAAQDGVQNSIGVGEEIQPGVRLVGVFFDHVMIERAGTRELLYLDQDDAPASATATTAAPAPTPTTGTASPAPPATAAPPAPISPASIRAGIGFAPRTANGRVTGISVASQGDGSAFDALGLRSGDVIRSINGRTIASAGDVAAFTAQLQPGARLSIEVERGASTAQLAILIPNGRP